MAESMGGPVLNPIASGGGSAVSIVGPLGSSLSAASVAVVVASDQSAIPVTGNFYQATQPVSGNVAVTGVATSANQTNKSQVTQIADASGNIIGSVANALNVAGSATSSGVPAGAFYIAANNGGTLMGLNVSGTTTDGGGGVGSLSTGQILYNGTTWDRLRDVVGARNTTGVGLLAAAPLLFDGADYQNQTVNSTATTGKFGADMNILSILGTAPTTVGKLDVKSADGDVFVRSNAASTFPVTASIASAQTLATVTTVSTVTNVSQINGVSPTYNSTTYSSKEAMDHNLLGTLGTAFTAAGYVNTLPSANATTVGASVSYQSGLTHTAVAIKASAGNLYGWHIYNPNTSVTYIQIYNVAQGSVSVGSTGATFVLIVPPLGWLDDPTAAIPISFSTAITVAATTTSGGSTAPTNNILATFFFI